MTVALAFVSLILALVGATTAEAAGKKKGSVQIGFVAVPPPGFQNVFLNVSGVRINPKANPNPGAKKWQTIPVPSVGEGSTGHPGDLQFDLNDIQDVPQLFNTAPVRKGTYVTAELLLDQTNPGTLVPNCSKAGSNEGCITYPFQLQNAGQPIQIGIGSISAAKGTQATLILQLALTIVQQPAISGGPYIVNLAIAPLSNQGNKLGTVSGTVSKSSGTVSTKKKIRKLTVTALVAGTNTAVASAPTQKNGSYVLTLPAAGPFGTFYDLAVSGGTVTYASARLPALIGGGQLTQDFTVAGSKSLGTISGTVSDGCNKTPIVGATVQLLIPPAGNLGADCKLGQCVTVASANTITGGNFPLPGNLLNPAPFENVPILASTDTLYTLMVTAPGYDPLFTLTNATKLKKGGTCGTAGSMTPCALNLTSATISGTVSVSAPPPGESVLVQVFAEDAGTNKIENALSMPLIIKGPSTSAPFTLTVPSEVASFDLFATSIDLFQGVTDPYQGHTIAVLPGVITPTACGTTAPQSIGSLDCVGHGSITGQVLSNPTDPGSSVVISKNNVQITRLPVQNLTPNSNPSNAFAFCVPADTYTIQKFELPTPAPGTAPISTPTPQAVNTPATVSIPTPALASPTASSTPCPSICSNPDGTCPGVCNNVPVSPL